MKDSEKFITAVKGRAQGLSFGSLAKRLGVPKSTIRGWLALAAELGLTYARLRLLSQKELQELLARKSPQRSSNKYEPRWEDFVIKAESPGDKGSLYRIYKDSCPSGVAPMSRSAFYRELFKMKEVLGPTLRPITIANSFEPGRLAMIDYSGDGLPITTETGKVSKAQIFVGVLGCSGLIYCQATPGQTREDWLTATAAMFHYFGGLTEELWLDNSTSLVKKADAYSPVLSEEFKAFCLRYGIVGYPVAPSKPRHKALVENAVRQCQNSILLPLSRRRFFSIAEANREILKELEKLNSRHLSACPEESRRSRFENKEKALLRPLPHPEYTPNSWVLDRKISADNQIRIHNSRYSVPWGHAGEDLRVVGNEKTGKLTFFLLETGEMIGEGMLRAAGEGNEATRMEHLPPGLQKILMTKSQLLELIRREYGDEALGIAVQMAKPNNSYAKRHLHGMLAKAKKFDRDTFIKICSQALQEPKVTWESFVRVCNFFEAQGLTRKPQSHAVTRKQPAQAYDPNEFRGAGYYSMKTERKF